jgi:hypothetical protein
MGDDLMKTLIKQILMLGGIYFIISFLLDMISEDMNTLYGIILFLIFFICFLVLCFRKRLMFLQKMQEDFPKTSVYLLSLGIVQYFAIFFISIPGMVYGYNAAKASYDGIEYVSVIPLYLTYAIYVYFAFIILAVLSATFYCFLRTKQQKK